MKKQFEIELIEKYPALFKDFGGAPNTTGLDKGILCGDGWYELISEMCADIQRYADSQGITQPIIYSISEQNGKLRVIVHSDDDAIQESIIPSFEHRSMYWCELCGSKEFVGHVFDGAFSFTRCYTCWKKTTNFDSTFSCSDDGPWKIILTMEHSGEIYHQIVKKYK